MSTSQAGGMGAPRTSFFFWSSGSSHTQGALEKVLQDRQVQVVLLAWCQHHHQAEKKSEDTGKDEDMANLLKKGSAVERLGAAHTDRLLPGPAPLPAQREDAHLYLFPPNYRSLFFPR